MNEKELGERITELRKQRNLTQLELAYELNVSDKTISKWETNNALPDMSRLNDLAKFFEISIEELLGIKKSNKKKKKIGKYIIFIIIFISSFISFIYIYDQYYKPKFYNIVSINSKLAVSGLYMSCHDQKLLIINNLYYDENIGTDKELYGNNFTFEILDNNDNIIDYYSLNYEKKIPLNDFLHHIKIFANVNLKLNNKFKYKITLNENSILEGELILDNK